MEAFRDSLRRSGPLLDIISQTEDAPQSLKLIQRQIKEIDTELSNTAFYLRFSTEEYNEERRNYEKYRDSVVQKHIYKVTGNEAKFVEKFEQGENRIKEISKIVDQLKSTEAELKDKKKNAQITQRALENDCRRQTRAEHEISAIFTSIFPNDSAPSLETGNAERKMQDALHAFQCSLARHEVNVKVVTQLEEASRQIKSCSSHIGRALDPVKTLLHVVPDLFSLQMAITESSRAHSAFSNAQRLSREVEDLPPKEMRPLILNWIKDFREQAKTFEQAVSVQLSAAYTRSNNSKNQIMTDAHLVESAGNERKKAQQNLLRSLLNDDMWEDPPSYSRDDHSTTSLPSYSEHNYPATSPPPYSRGNHPTTLAQEESQGTTPMSQLPLYEEGSSFRDSYQEES
ncbi:hypothetical protein F4678DRAFT_480688 [Xylaria arbuscula]|nr:hypothetical protein F4678DRAFT_480688 [Xylaria arbuscula]